jgi:hypothetical protein
MIFGLASADEASASAAGGSRLLYYFTQTAFEPGAATGTALTIFTVSNNSTSSVNAKYTIYRGSDCTRTGPTSLTLAAGETKLIDVSTLVSYPSGVIDLWASTPGGTPIRHDALSGKSVVVDFGSATVTSAVVPALKLFSDNRAKDDQSTIPDENLAQENAPLIIVGDFFPNGATGITDTIALFGPAIQPGAVPPPSTGASAIPLNYYAFGGAKTPLTALSTPCVYSNTLANAVGPLASSGGKIDAAPGAGKGLAGWKFSKIHTAGVTLLFGELLTSTLTSVSTGTNQ